MQVMMRKLKQNALRSSVPLDENLLTLPPEIHQQVIKICSN